MDKPKVVMVAAIGKNRELGLEGKLLWHIPDDLKRFKALTLGHPIIMGRKTFDSIVAMLGKALPGRTNLVVTRSPTLLGIHDPNVRMAHSLEEALEKARSLNPTEIHIGGGAQLYEQALPFTDKLCLTLIDDEKEADSFFPPYEHLFTKTVKEEAREYHGLTYRWVDLEK